MAVLVHDPIQEAMLQLAEQVQASYEKGAPCGMILAPSAEVGQKVLEHMQSYVSSFEPEVPLHGFYLDPSGLLGIVLSGQKLINTHYTSLVLKEFLEQQNLLEGQMVVASFPESGELTEQSMSQLLHTTLQGKGENRDIHLFMHHGVQQGITSILIADPDEVSREFVKLRLEIGGYKVEEAKDGSEALEKFEKTMPDLVITELNLPILDGYQLIDKIQRDHAGEGQVIVLTDKQLPKSMDRAFELGASDYVTKPFSISELEWRIKKLVSRLG
ncbi:response regulator [Paenibacillus sp. CGMCC 1.16610]|uniref:Response regulator n=1 Tax=Paenibacillus anseongense TaxID=2682845 RepID=A0ABW9TZ10_9BACL|nr:MULTISPECIES: response regulator [Paenibacillus]MBA2943591.1 response regulator [Paenibacillus sp. CGMCC 1.16610]MVQ33087.1 response regulator [Paenibacillus anseongense]